jgi:hypothetical protein
MTYRCPLNGDLLGDCCSYRDHGLCLHTKAYCRAELVEEEIEQEIEETESEGDREETE